MSYFKCAVCDANLDESDIEIKVILTKSKDTKFINFCCIQHLRQYILGESLEEYRKND